MSRAEAAQSQQRVDNVHELHPAEPKSSALGQRFDGTFTVDPWGFDSGFASLGRSVVNFRWSVSVAHPGRIPTNGPALLVVNRRFGASELPVLAAGLAQQTGRQVRVANVVDVPILASVQRRFGSILRHPDEISGVLRAGHIVVMPLSRTPLRRRAVGKLDTEQLESAVSLGAPIIPVAVRGRELGRKWHVTVGRPLRAKLTTDPSAIVTLAQRARSAVEDML